MASRKRLVVSTFVITIVLVIVSVWFIGYDRVARKLHSFGPPIVLDSSQGAAEFPDIDIATATSLQAKIVTLTRQEFTLQPPGTKFSEGVNEAWCADFVSWIMNEAGMPLENPNSGSWRIPGTFTLQDYYVTAGRFMAVNSGYEPKLGDVAIYRGSPVFGDHANIILSNRNGVLTTVGGNEDGRIRVYVNIQKNYDGLLGYGTMEEG